MSIAIRYYTRSGHTTKIANAISEEIGVPAETIDTPLEEKVDTLFLGCSYYAFDMDAQVKDFLKANKDKIGEIVCFGTSAMMKSMKKPLYKVTKDFGIKISDQEYHCRGEFKGIHKGRPNADDVAAAKAFAKKFVG